MNIEAVVKRTLEEAITYGRTFKEDGDEIASFNFDDAARQLCQLFPKTEDNPNGFEVKSNKRRQEIEASHQALTPEGAAKPSASRLLTGDEFSKPTTDEELRLYESEGRMLIGRQDAKTTSIKDQEYAEHLAHLVDDVINLEEKLKSKDAEKKQLRMCVGDLKQQLRELERECQAKVTKANQLGFQAGRDECQQRVEGIKRRITNYLKDRKDRGFVPSMISWLETLWKEEGI